MPLLAVVLFFVYTWGLGFSLTRLAKAKEQESFLERNLMRTGIGLSVFLVLGIILNALKIPLDYRIFLAAAVALPLYELVVKKSYKKASPHAPSAQARIKLKK